MVFLAIFGSACVFALAWVEVTRTIHGSKNRLDSISSQFEEIRTKMAAIDPDNLRRLQDEISALKTKGIWR